MRLSGFIQFSCTFVLCSLATMWGSKAVSFQDLNVTQTEGSERSAGDAARSGVKRKLDETGAAASGEGSASAKAVPGIGKADRQLLKVTSKLASKNARDIAYLKAAVFSTHMVPVISPPYRFAEKERANYTERMKALKEKGEENEEGGPEKVVFRGLLNGTIHMLKDDGESVHRAKLEQFINENDGDAFSEGVNVCHFIKAFKSTQKEA